MVKPKLDLFRSQYNDIKGKIAWQKTADIEKRNKLKLYELYVDVLVSLDSEYVYKMKDVPNLNVESTDSIFDILLKCGLNKFYDSIQQAMITTVDDLYNVTDVRLIKLGIPVNVLEVWRKHLPYTESTWQRKLYDVNFGDYVIFFEKYKIKQLNEVNDT
eukprot:UN03974